jgi:purine-binding chemotaxis protein CheW
MSLFETRSSAEILTFSLGDLEFALPVTQVQEVLLHKEIQPVPLASAELAGLFGLRGQIVTAVHLRKMLDLGGEAPAQYQNILINDGVVLYSLLVDLVGEVVEVRQDHYDPVPANMDERFREYCIGLIRLRNKLIILLDANKLLQTQTK